MAYASAPRPAPRVADCESPWLLAAKLSALRDRYADELGAPADPAVDDCVRAYGAFAERVELVDERFLGRLMHAVDVVFEGVQGVLLDEWHGFHPYTTWSTTTFANGEILLAEAGLAGEAVRPRRPTARADRRASGPVDALTGLIQIPVLLASYRPSRTDKRVGRGNCGTACVITGESGRNSDTCRQ